MAKTAAAPIVEVVCGATSLFIQRWYPQPPLVPPIGPATPWIFGVSPAKLSATNLDVSRVQRIRGTDNFMAMARKQFNVEPNVDQGVKTVATVYSDLHP